MLKLLGMFLVVTLGYILLYTGYALAAKDMPGRVTYVAAVVVGTLIGSTIGAWLFK